MLRKLERSITLQLLIFYGLFILPLLLGGVELYMFQRDALQQSTQRTDRGIAQAISLEVASNIRAAVEEDSTLSTSQAATQLNLSQLTSNLKEVQRQLATNGEAHIWIVDQSGSLLASTEHVPFRTNLRPILPSLHYALQQETGSVIAHEEGRDWLYSYVPIEGTHWSVVLQRPTDVAFSALISFQNSLLIALVTLLVGASFFWFALHGWVVSPLSKLALAVSMIRPDQPAKVADGELLARDRGRVDEIGTLISAFSVMEDEIHALFRKSDEKSQTRLHTLDAIMRSMDEGVLLEQRDGHVIYANQSFTQFVGISPQELLLEDSFDDSQVEEKLLAMIEDPDDYLEAIRCAEDGSGSQTVAFQTRGYYNRTGQLVSIRRDIRLRLFQVRDLTGNLIGRGKIFRDVTQQNEAEQIKKNLLAIVSHELRTPLTAIKGYATSLLATDVELDASLQAYFLRRIVEEGDRMAELVTNLLEMSQLEAGTLKLSPSLHNLNMLIEQVVSREEYQHTQVHIPPAVPLLYVDGRRIEMMLRNLLENARRYAGANTAIEIFVRHEQAQQDHSEVEDGLYLHISDTGPGLPPDLTERIFDRFYQVDGGMQRSTSGVGLGLAICRGVVEAHGGRIWAENRIDGVTGAVFHIWFPPKILYTSGTEPNTFELHTVL
jgi:signal transduction histidine kinase